MSTRMGRPSSNPKTERLNIRVAPDEKKEIMEFVEKYNIGLLDLIKLGMEAKKE